MRKASMVLGIIGGVTAILIGLLIISGSIVFMSVMMDEITGSDDFQSYNEQEQEEYYEESVNPESVIRLIETFYVIWGVLILISGILGVVGAALVNRKNVLAGALMLVGCAISLFTFWGFIAFLLMLLGGIFALVKDSSAPQTPNVPDMPSGGYDRL